MGFLDIDHPAEWDEIAQLQAGLWPKTRWSDASIKAAWILMRDVPPRTVMQALGELAREGGERAAWSPEPGVVAEKAREIVIRNRPALPPPPRSTEEIEADASFERWANEQPEERRARAQELRRRMREAKTDDERRQVLAELVQWRRPPAQDHTSEEARAALEAQALANVNAPISPDAERVVEEMVRAGEEARIPPRYAYLIPAIKARMTPKAPARGRPGKRISRPARRP